MTSEAFSPYKYLLKGKFGLCFVKYETPPFISTFRKPYPFFNNHVTSLFLCNLLRPPPQEFIFLFNLSNSFIISFLQYLCHFASQLLPIRACQIDYSQDSQDLVLNRQLTISILVSEFINTPL